MVWNLQTPERMICLDLGTDGLFEEDGTPNEIKPRLHLERRRAGFYAGRL